MRIGQGLPCAGHRWFQSISARFPRDPPHRTLPSPSAEVVRPFNNIFKNVKEALRERKRRELEGNNGETPSSEEQDVLHGRASMPQQGQQLVEDHTEENFP